MSKKHVIDYYNKVSQQYLEMLEALKDLESECTNNIVEPERVEQIQKMIEPLKNNYMTWSYVMYLFNLPNREKKTKAVIRRNGRKNDVGGFKENRSVLHDIKEKINA